MPQTHRVTAPRRAVRVVGALVLLALAPACSLQRLTSRVAVQLIDDGVTAINAEADLELARASSGASLKLLDALLEQDSANDRLLLSASEGYVGYATAFAGRDRVRASVLYTRARDYALRAWTAWLRGQPPLSPAAPRLDAATLVADATALDAALARGADAVPYAYWTAASWSGLIDVNRGDPALLADLPIVRRLAHFVAERDSGFAFGGADLLLGVMAGAVPAVAGGDPDAARDHFERALAAAERRFLMTQVLYAETYAIAQQDRALFDQLLDEIAAANIDLLPEQRLANVVAKERGAALRARADRLFL